MATAAATATTTTAAAQRQLGGFDHDCCGSTAAWWLRPRQRPRSRPLRLNGGLAQHWLATTTYDHGVGYDHNRCGPTAASPPPPPTATTTPAAAHPRLVAKTTVTATAAATATTRIVATKRRLGGYGHGNGYDRDCCGSTATWWLRPRMLRLNGGLAATTTATGSTTTAAAQRLLCGYDRGHRDVHAFPASPAAAWLRQRL